MNSSTCRILLDGVIQVDLDDQSRYFLEQGYLPAPAGLLENGLVDSITPVQEEIQVLVSGETRDEIIQNRARINHLLRAASHYYYNRRSGRPVVIETAAAGGTRLVRSLVAGGQCTSEVDIIGKTRRGRWLQPAKVRIVRDPIWSGDAEAITLSSSPSNNGLLGYATLPLLHGDQPSQLKLRLVCSGAGASEAKRVYAWLRSNGTPANYTHILQAEDYSSKHATGANLADANLSSGNGVRFTATGTTENMLLRWETSTNVEDQFAVAMPILRYRDKSSAIGWKFRMLGGVKVGSTYVRGPYTCNQTKTLFADASATTEIGILPLGILNTPAIGSADQGVGTLFYELYGEALVAGNVCDIDFVELATYGEGSDGTGLVVAEFDAALSTNRVYLDSRTGYDPAYISNTSDVKLTSSTDIPEGAQIFAWSQRAGQRIYFMVTRSITDFLKHDHTIGLSLVAEYVPRYADLAHGE